jgi:hypothetical protein
MGGTSSVLNHEDGINSSIRLINFSDFKELGLFPQYPLNQDKAIALNHFTEAQYKDSLIIFVSHVWLRGSSNMEGWDGKAHPDDVSNAKYKLCVEGIEVIVKELAPGLNSCYLWIDFGCVDQSNNPALEIRALDKIMQLCDCIFTPIVDAATHFPENPSIFFTQYKSPAWSGPSPTAYLNRAWCRLEMLYGANIPLMEEDIHESRSGKMQGDLLIAKKEGRRPHIVYSTTASMMKKHPIVLAPIERVWFEINAPLNGFVNHESDKGIIAKLSEDLKPYLKVQHQEHYEGELNSEGKREGRGKCVFPNTDSYEGDWKNDMMSGRGKYLSHIGDIYEGEFQANVREGKGILIAADGSVYEGEFHDNKKAGKGKFIYVKGDVYDGDFLNNFMEGIGKYTSKSGDIYIGQFQRGFMEGKGKFQYASGDVYEGMWKNNTKHGFGIFRSASGDRYEGEWLNGKMHGTGKYYTSTNEMVYDGLWRHGDVFMPSSTTASTAGSDNEEESEVGES